MSISMYFSGLPGRRLFTLAALLALPCALWADDPYGGMNFSFGATVGGIEKEEPAAPVITQEANLSALTEKFENLDLNDPSALDALMEDVVNTSDVVELKVGEEPTHDQLKKAGTDMVWIKEEEVAGFKILIPVVYLKEEDKNKSPKK